MSRYTEDPERDERRGPNWGKTFAIVLSIVLAVVVVFGAAVLYMGHSLFSLTRFQNKSEVQVVQNVEDLPEEAVETISSEQSVGMAVDEQQLQEIQATMEKVDEKVTVAQTDDTVFNVVLTGVDRRDKTWNGNSDSMMLVSINYEQKRVSIISLMRDTYVNIPGVGYAKLNNAYAQGGGPLMCETISENYNIEVDKYAAVDFEDMMDIVDALGGVELEMTEAEVNIANMYITDMCNTLNMNVDEHLISGSGTIYCTGIQAVGYARNRFVGNSDYARTERQRYVISQILKKIKTLSIPELTVFVTKVLPLITHNIDEGDIWDLVTKAPDILTYTFVTDRVPYDDLYSVIYVDGQDMLVPDWEETIAQLHNTIYGDGEASDNSDNNDEDRSIAYADYNKDELDAAAKRAESESDSNAS